MTYSDPSGLSPFGGGGSSGGGGGSSGGGGAQSLMGQFLGNRFGDGGSSWMPSWYVELVNYWLAKDARALAQMLLKIDTADLSCLSNLLKAVSNKTGDPEMTDLANMSVVLKDVQTELVKIFGEEQHSSMYALWDTQDAKYNVAGAQIVEDVKMADAFRAMLNNPVGSLYESEAMRQYALNYLNAELKARGGTIDIRKLDSKNPKDAMLLQTLAKFMGSSDGIEISKWLATARVDQGKENLSPAELLVLNKESLDIIRQVSDEINASEFLKWGYNNVAVAMMAQGFVIIVGGIAQEAINGRYAKQGNESGQKTTKTNNSSSKDVDSFIKNNVDPSFQKNVIKAFGSDIKVATLTKDITVYRYYGGNATASSYWVTPNKVINPVSELALPPGNTAQYLSSMVIPKGTTILEGTVAPNFGQPGGGYQYYVP